MREIAQLVVFVVVFVISAAFGLHSSYINETTPTPVVVVPSFTEAEIVSVKCGPKPAPQEIAIAGLEDTAHLVYRLCSENVEMRYRHTAPLYTRGTQGLPLHEFSNVYEVVRD